MADPSIVAVDSTLIKAKGSAWHKSSIWRKEKYHALASMQTPGRDIVIQKDGYFDINYI